MCERDAFADLVEEFKSSGVIGCHRKGLKMCRNSFTGLQLVDWLHSEKGMGKFTLHFVLKHLQKRDPAERQSQQ